MRHVFVVNPMAGKGQFSEKFISSVKETATGRGLDYSIHITSAPGEGIEYVRGEARKAETGDTVRFYSCGGDGTLYEVVNGAASFKNCEVAAVPLGSGNDFIRLFGTKEELRDVNVHIDGTPTQLDLIKCGDRYAINQCSMGFDAEVCAKQGSFKKLKFLNGESAYTASLLYCFINKMEHEFTITVDDGEPFTTSVIFCVAGNSRWYGGGYMAAPKAMPNDGLLDFIIVKKKMSKLKLLTMINGYKNGQHLDWDVTTFVRGKKLNIKSPELAAVNIDGETEYVNESTFEIIEKGITFVLPKGTSFDPNAPAEQ